MPPAHFVSILPTIALSTEMINLCDGLRNEGTCFIQFWTCWNSFHALKALSKLVAQLRKQYAVYYQLFCSIPIAKSTLFAIPFRLGECESISCMKSRIFNMEYLNGHTYTYYALRRAMEVSMTVYKNWLHFSFHFDYWISWNEWWTCAFAQFCISLTGSDDMKLVSTSIKTRHVSITPIFLHD